MYQRIEKMIRKPGDWNCSSCEYFNFRRRDSCNSCGDLKSIGSDRFTNFNGGRRGSSFVRSGSDVRPGDWYCQCSAHNFAGRSNCIKCGAFKEGLLLDSGMFDLARLSYVTRSGRRARWKSGDWICTRRSGCNEHNFASRMECFRCCAPRESGAEVGGDDYRDDIIEMTKERKEIT